MSKSVWGVTSTRHDQTGRSNVEYLDQMTGMFQQLKIRLIDSLQLESGQHALDAGCGTGDDVRLMAERVGPIGSVVGYDHADAMIEESRARSEGSDLPVEFVQGDLYDMPFEDNVFDAVRSDRVFQHLDRPHEALAELVRVTKPGGRISLHDQDADSTTIDFPDRKLYRHIRHWSSDNFLANGFSGRMFYRLCKQAGLEIELIDIMPVYVTNLEVADSVVNVSGWAQDLLEAGDITPDDAEAWVRTLNELDAAGQFFAFGVGINVVARKPA